MDLRSKKQRTKKSYCFCLSFLAISHLAITHIKSNLKYSKHKLNKCK